ncbi:MAG: hypothetical protein IH820_10250 [Bacteroidetes bacterium]|nr:hypothetical protein [Bacteroidota bacterium]
MNNATYKAPSSILAAFALLRKKRHHVDSKKEHATQKAKQADATVAGLSYPIYVARHGIGVKGLL